MNIDAAMIQQQFNQQQFIDREVRSMIGDLTLQLVFARARIAELEQQLLDVTPKDRPNGVAEKAGKAGKEAAN